MSAAAAAAVVVAAEDAAAAAGDVPTNLKQDIVPLARLDNGLELYRFRYRDGDPTIYVGVMAQDVQKIKPAQFGAPAMDICGSTTI